MKIMKFAVGMIVGIHTHTTETYNLHRERRQNDREGVINGWKIKTCNHTIRCYYNILCNNEIVHYTFSESRTLWGRGVICRNAWQLAFPKR